MTVEIDKLRKAAHLLAEAMALLGELADGESPRVPDPLGEVAPEAASHASGEQLAPVPGVPLEEDLTCIEQRLAQRQITVRGALPIGEVEQGLLTLAHVMGQKYATIEPLLAAIKRSQSHRRPIHMDLSNLSQEQIADITLIAGLADKAGLLPGYKYSKSPRYKLRCDSLHDPLAINFFTGQWLELFVARTVENQRATLDVDFRAAYRLVIALPNGDQFELDAVLAVGQRLIWIEAKTTDEFARHLRKYRKVSGLLCDSPRDALLLWAGLKDEGDLFKKTRGAVAHMTACSPRTLPDLLHERLVAQQLAPPMLPR